ncbi:MAG: hypothetical protein HFF13_09600 [Angelakisella sp.]|nr:hypothetical protein [Angelakisella sp.]
MDLTPLYELRERLRAGAIAGAALAADDFRLARALEGLAPLEKASPVFAKLGQLARSVLAPDCQDRAGALLDAITLCDAVLTTQGAVAVPGELEALPPRAGGTALTNAPYSVVAPLVEALTTSGSGHYSTVVDTHETHPELFSDYRVRDALVKALGAKYAELADTAGQWLCQEDKSILPLLTQGFDPAGKKEMARRVQVIDTIAGGSLNDWYISQLEGAKKQVRVMLIYALRHCPENLELLLKLAKTEKYDNKDAARWALARIQNPGALPFWREMMEADLIENGRFFMASNSPAATALTAELLERELEDLLAPDDAPWYTEKEKRLANLLYALVGKTGPAICDAYRKGAALGTKLDGSRAWKNGKGHINEQMFFQRPGGQKHPFSVALVEVLNQSIQWNPDPGLCALAEELYESYGGLWAGPAVCAALLTKGAEEAAAVGKKLLAPSLLERLTGKEEKQLLMNLVFGELAGPGGALPDFMRQGMDIVRPAYRRLNNDPAGLVKAFWVDLYYTPIAAPLDGWWYDLMMRHRMDQKLQYFIDKEDPALCQKIGEYFCRRIKMGVLDMPLQYAFSALTGCGWTQWKGLLLSYIQHTSQSVHYWEVRNILQYLPISSKEKGEELADIYAKGRFSGWPEKTVERQIQDWLAD